MTLAVLGTLGAYLFLAAGEPSHDAEGSPPVQRGPEVSGSRSDASPPLKDIPPAKRSTKRRVHPVKPLPRPKPIAEEGDGGKAPPPPKENAR